VDKLFIGYLTVTAVICLALPTPGLLPLLHLALILSIWGSKKLSPSWRAVRECYAVPLLPSLYLELDKLSQIAGGRIYDETVIKWETVLFGDPSPAMWLSQKLPWIWLSEILHLCYLSFYLLLFFLGIRFYRQGRIQVLRVYLWSICSAVFTIHLIQMFFPVMGPRPLYPPLADNLHGPFWYLCHFLCGQGASGAAAFPSGHVTFAVAVALAANRWDRAASRWLTPMAVGLTLSTVYGRFHYAVDALAGIMVGWFFMEFGPTLYDWAKGKEGGESFPGAKNPCHER
jgi:membrane-associated phospholipid phosphatase